MLGRRCGSGVALIRPSTQRRGRAFYARHRDSRAAQIEAYHAAHPHVRRTAWERRRARLLQAEGAYTTKEWTALVEIYSGRCAYCGIEGPVQADHRVPLSRGGTNLIENILPACPPCNTRKGSLTENEFRERLRRERGDGGERSPK